MADPKAANTVPRLRMGRHVSAVVDMRISNTTYSSLLRRLAPMSWNRSRGDVPEPQDESIAVTKSKAGSHVLRMPFNGLRSGLVITKDRREMSDGNGKGKWTELRA